MLALFPNRRSIVDVLRMKDDEKIKTLGQIMDWNTSMKNSKIFVENEEMLGAKQSLAPLN